MIKKIIGYLFYLLGLLFSLSFIGNSINLIKGRVPENTTAQFENFFALIIAGTLAYFLLKYARKWTAKKITNEIDEIGKIN